MKPIFHLLIIASAVVVAVLGLLTGVLHYLHLRTLGTDREELTRILHQARIERQEFLAVLRAMQAAVEGNTAIATALVERLKVHDSATDTTFATRRQT